MAAFVALASGEILTNAPTSDETPHLVAGYSYLVTGDYRLNPEHPPLLKAFAAVPLLFMRVWPAGFHEAADGARTFPLFREAWAMAVSNPGAAEWKCSQYLLYALRDAALERVHGDPAAPPTDVLYSRADFLNQPARIFPAARFMMLAIAVVLAIAVFTWSYSLWGLPGAVVSLLLFSFDPNFIVHAGLITTDVGATTLMFLACYFFWRTCGERSIRHIVLFASFFALAQIAKFSSVVLIPMLVATGCAACFRQRKALRFATAFGAAAVLTVAVIWAAYGFRYSAARDPAAALAEEQNARAHLELRDLMPRVWPTGYLPLQDTINTWYVVKRLAVETPNGFTEAEFRKAVRTTPIGTAGRAILWIAERRLLPEAFLYGFASTAAGSVRISYLNGRYSTSGFPFFFLWTFLYKTPIPIVILAVAGALHALRRLRTRPELLFALIPALVFAAFAFASSIHIGHRHIMPSIPFLYTLAGSLGTLWASLSVRARRAFAAAVLFAIPVSANVVFAGRPAVVLNQHLAYLNEFAGGPIAGWDKLSDSNFDWGQDMGRLAGWLREHKIEQPVDLMVFGNADPRYYGIRYNNFRLDSYVLPDKPGLVAISQLEYLGILFDFPHRTFWRDFLERSGARRIGTAGYSIFLYQVDQLP